MRFTKQQKKIIQKIHSGEVYDILSFVNIFQQQRIARYDWLSIQQKYREDPMACTYYCPKGLEPTPANLMREDVFTEKQNCHEVDPERYSQLLPSLSNTCANHEEVLYGQHFSFDFYQGVQILDSFENLVDFLSIWQFLRENTLVLEVPQAINATEVGLFFEKMSVPADTLTPKVQEDTLIFSDRRYLKDGEYRLSEERLVICRKFLGKRIYPAPGLNLFIQNSFRTRDEVMQDRSLAAAWAAIILSLLISLFQYCVPSRDTANSSAQQSCNAKASSLTEPNQEITQSSQEE